METAQGYVWYHDLKWQISQDDGIAKKVSLLLSDKTQVEFEFESAEQLQGLIKKLENCI